MSVSASLWEAMISLVTYVRMTPLPKNLPRETMVSVETVCELDAIPTYLVKSNTELGTCRRIKGTRLDKIGNMVPKIEVACHAEKPAPAGERGEETSGRVSDRRSGLDSFEKVTVPESQRWHRCAIPPDRRTWARRDLLNPTS